MLYLGYRTVLPAIHTRTMPAFTLQIQLYLLNYLVSYLLTQSILVVGACCKVAVICSNCTLNA